MMPGTPLCGVGHRFRFQGHHTAPGTCDQSRCCGLLLLCVCGCAFATCCGTHWQSSRHLLIVVGERMQHKQRGVAGVRLPRYPINKPLHALAGVGASAGQRQPLQLTRVPVLCGTTCQLAPVCECSKPLLGTLHA